MGYESAKDKVLYHTEFDEKGEGRAFLQISVMSYDGGEPKVQMIRRYDKDDGSSNYTRLGRVTKAELEFLLTKSDKILEVMGG